MTTYAYIRVSTDKQDLDNQRHGVIEYAKQHALEPLTFFDDPATSSRKHWRKRGLGQLLEQAQKGDILLVAEISRLARSTLQVLEVLQVAAERGIAVHVVKNRMVMDGSLHARITATVLGLAAEIEREFISARTTEALARRKAAGLPLGRPKGRLNDTYKLDEHAVEIRKMLRSGMKKTAIARTLKCSPQTLYDWMKANGLSRFIKPKEEIKTKSA